MKKKEQNKIKNKIKREIKSYGTTISDVLVNKINYQISVKVNS